jgi:predicted AAA+ superfamily ATPase
MATALQLGKAAPLIADDKPKVIGLYGISGCGKSTLLNKLKTRLDKKHFAFYEGAEVIASRFDGDFDDFKALPEEDKLQYRK